MRGRALGVLTLGVLCASVLGVARAGDTPAAEPSAASARSSGHKLVTRNVRWQRTRIGGLLVFGETVNRGTAAAADVGVLVELYNNRRERLARFAQPEARSYAVRFSDSR